MTSGTNNGGSSQAADLWRSPLSGRYASQPMQRLLGDRSRFRTWRRLWTELARAQQQLGLEVSAEQVAALEANIEPTDEDLTIAAAREKEVRHDVMAHVHAFGEATKRSHPSAAAQRIIHLGMTSNDIVDNADLVLFREALSLLHARTVPVIRNLARLAKEHASLPCLGFTHYQPAMPTTVGKRIAAWLQDLLGDADRLATLRDTLPYRGLKGATGTQASYLNLFDGDASKVVELEKRWAAAVGFKTITPLTGQTYPRKQDIAILEPLGQLAATASKLANDVRLLANLREIEEPFGKDQIGSSAMPWKRNPMKCERINALARALGNVLPNALQTAQAQWLERTLDDSANRRLALSEGFLLADALLLLLRDVTDGLVVNEPIITANLAREMPFLAAEPIMMAAVRAGGDRQDLHERLRLLTHAAVAKIKQGEPNHGLADALRADADFGQLPLDRLLDPSNPIHIGRAPEQVLQYLTEIAEPWLQQHADVTPPEGEIKV